VTDPWLKDGDLANDLFAGARAAILYRTHFWDAAVEAEVRRLIETAGADYDVWVVGYVGGGADFSVPAPIRKLTFTNLQLRVMGLPGCSRHVRVNRHLDLPPVCFFRMLPDYEHYWIIEYDVRYTGDWRALLDELDNPRIDLLATAIQRRRENPGWHHWDTLCTGGVNIAAGLQVKAFTPLMRLSNRAFQAVDLAYRSGWHGHYEALWATAIAVAGQRIEDIGGGGSFTPPYRRGRHYSANMMDPMMSPGSFVFRPVKTAAEIAAGPPMLWHPVKPAAAPGWFAGAAE
jgi:hypothetical protein